MHTNTHTHTHHIHTLIHTQPHTPHSYTHRQCIHITHTLIHTTHTHTHIHIKNFGKMLTALHKLSIHCSKTIQRKRVQSQLTEIL